MNEAKTILSSKVRYYLCNEHKGSTALVELSDAIQEAKSCLSEAELHKTINDVLAAPPGYKDRQDLEATIEVKIMKFQCQVKKAIEHIEIESKSHKETKYPTWSVAIKMAEDPPTKEAP